MYKIVHANINKKSLRSSTLFRRCHLIFIALVVCTFFLFTEVSRAQDIQLTACECLKKPGDNLQVKLGFSNTGNRPLAMLTAFKAPDGRWRFYSPAGLILAPTWLPIPAQTISTEIDLLNETLTTESLPFGHVPLVGPFRYEFIAALYDIETQQQVTPFSYTFFDFAPAPPALFPDQEGSLFLIPHQHNDIAWLEREDINLELGADFINNSIIEALRRPEFHFIVDQKPILEAFAQKYPEQREILQNLINNGTCELAGGFLVEPDLNLLSGESLVRQAIYGQEYLETVWGYRSRIAWHIDAFGHPHQLPQICSKAGMDYYAFFRGVGDPTMLGGSEFYWQSPDGSRVIAHHMVNSYQIGREIGQLPETDQEISEIWQLLNRSSSTSNLLGPVGADANERVFNQFVPEAVDNWNLQQIPAVKADIQTPGVFFESVEKSGIELPLIHNTEFMDEPGGSPAGTNRRVLPGSYATRIEVKKKNNEIEHLLLDVEKLATMASIEGYLYPAESLRRMAESISLNQTHDYLSGSGVDEIYEDNDNEINDFGDRLAAIETDLANHLQQVGDYFSSHISTEAVDSLAQQAFIVFNTMAWDRIDLVHATIDSPDNIFPAKLIDSAGQEIVYQRIQNEQGEDQIIFLANIPSMGYETFQLLPGDPILPPSESVSYLNDPLDLNLGSFTVTIDEHAHILQIVANTTGQPLMPSPAKPAGFLWWEDEIYGDAYHYDELQQNTGLLTDRPQTVYLLQGPVMTRLIAVSTLADLSMAVREIRFLPQKEQIDFITTIYWADVNKNVYVQFPFETISGNQITQGVPYGFMDRHTGRYPALRWSEFGNDSLGVSLLNRGLFGHRYSQETNHTILDITLLRSLDRAVFGDIKSESMKEHGVHRARYSLVPHLDSWENAQIPRRAWEFNSPLLVFPCDIHPGNLPPKRSYLALDSSSEAIVTVMQRQGEDIALRLYETTGQIKTHTLSFPFFNAASVTETNLLGDSIKSFGSGNSVFVITQPQEIMTLHLNNNQVVNQ